MGKFLDGSGLAALVKLIKSGTTQKTISLAYSQLKTLRDGNKLVPGQSYRITDFVTTTTQAETRSASHPFDVIVVADSASKLNENARATLHEGDTYFTTSKLEAWELKYSLDNDTTKYSWADATNGKGVIWWMKDEWNNECFYDFKNIQYKVYAVSGDDWDTYCTDNPNGIFPSSAIPYRLTKNMAVKRGKKYTWTRSDTDFVYAYTWSNYNESTKGMDDSSCYTNSPTGICNNKINGYFVGSALTLNFVMAIPMDKTNGPKLIKASGNVIGENCHDIILSTSCSDCVCGNNCEDIICGVLCYSWACGDNCAGWTCGNQCTRWKCGNDCVNWVCAHNCSLWTCGNDCSSWTCSNYCTRWTCRNQCSSWRCNYNSNNWTCGNDCSSWACDHDCSSWACGNDCSSWTCGNGCSYWTCGNKCNSWTCGNGCGYWTCGNGCSSWTCGDACVSWTCGDDCSYWTCVDVCSSWTCGNGCYSNMILQNYVWGFHLGDGVQNITIKSSGTPTYKQKLQNIVVKSGVRGASSSKKLEIIIDTANFPLNSNYQWTIAKNSKGEIKQYCEADLIN